MLQGEDRLYLNPEDGLGESSISSHQSPSAIVGNRQWHIMNLPPSYLINNWPIRVSFIFLIKLKKAFPRIAYFLFSISTLQSVHLVTGLLWQEGGVLFTTICPLESGGCLEMKRRCLAAIETFTFQFHYQFQEIFSSII